MLEHHSVTAGQAHGVRSTPRPISPIRAWWLAIRPKTLPVAVVPVAVGSASAHAHGHFSWPVATATLLGALFIQIGTNLTNDLSDHAKGADTADRLGPLRVAQAGWIPSQALRRGIVVSFLLATVAGAYLVTHAGWTVVAIGLVSIVAGVLYTAGPFALAYMGLGDLFVVLFFGWVAVLGTHHVQGAPLTAVPWLAGTAVGCGANTLLVVNNLRDRHTDATARKRTLVVRFGPTLARWEYGGLWLITFAMPVVLWGVVGVQPWILLPLWVSPAALWLAQKVNRRDGAALNPLLGMSALLLVAFGSLLTVGLLLQ